MKTLRALAVWLGKTVVSVVLFVLVSWVVFEFIQKRHPEMLAPITIGQTNTISFATNTVLRP